MRVRKTENFATIIALGFILFGIWMILPKSDKNTAKRALESAGYNSVQFQGSSFLGCGQGDVYRTKFKAKSLNGTNVEGIVCRGLFKGSTIRTY